MTRVMLKSILSVTLLFSCAGVCAAENPPILFAFPIYGFGANTTCAVAGATTGDLESKYLHLDKKAPTAAYVFGNIIHDCIGPDYKDNSDHYYLFVFPSTVLPGPTNHVLLSYRQTAGGFETRFLSSTLQGTREINIVAFADLKPGDTATFGGQLVETAVPNPALSSLGSVVSQATGNGSLFGLLGNGALAEMQRLRAQGEETPPQPPPATPGLHFGWQSVGLRQTSATIAESDQLTVPDYVNSTKDQPKSNAMKGSGLTITNSGRTQFGITALGGFKVGPVRGKQKMQVSSGSYAVNPLSDAITMVALAWYPFPYDASAPSITKRERVSLLAGVMLTPAAGFGTGLSVGLVRGFALNAGFAGMWYPTAVNNLLAGNPAPTGNQLTNTFGHTFFLGANYVFGSGGSSSGGSSANGGGGGGGGKKGQGQ